MPADRILLVFAQETMMEKNKVARKFYLVTQEEYEFGTMSDNPRIRVYSKFKSGLLNPKPGSVYSVETKDEDGNTVYPSTARYEGLWRNDEQRLYWTVEHEKHLIDKAAKALEKKNAKKDALDVAVEPLRNLYQRCFGTEKTALLAAIIRRITK